MAAPTDPRGASHAESAQDPDRPGVEEGGKPGEASCKGSGTDHCNGHFVGDHELSNESGSPGGKANTPSEECEDGVDASRLAAAFVVRNTKPSAGSSKRQACGLCWIWERFVSAFAADVVEYNMQALEMITDIGYGTFGRVSLVWCHQTGQALALKAMSKGLVARRKLQNAVRSEKMIMSQVRSPFLTKLAATFNRGEHVYILMEVARGGDLHTVYCDNALFGYEEHAVFYAACMVCALEYLHAHRILYRDLKMENVVLSAKGYAKLCDFGLSRFLWPAIGSAWTNCGTPEYKAPEIYAGTGYNHAVDWWALGVLVYELMVGNTPFVAESASSIYEKVCAGFDCVIPPSDRRAWVGLVRGLCQKDPSKRLGLVHGGVCKTVKGHDWFKESAFDWQGLGCCTLSAPYVPALDGPTDVKHCRPKATCAPQEEHYTDQVDSWEDDFENPIGPRNIEV